MTPSPKVRLTVQISQNVDMQDSTGWLPVLGFMKTSIITHEQAHGALAYRMYRYVRY